MSVMDLKHHCTLRGPVQEGFGPALAYLMTTKVVRLISPYNSLIRNKSEFYALLIEELKSMAPTTPLRNTTTYPWTHIRIAYSEEGAIKSTLGKDLAASMIEADQINRGHLQSGNAFKEAFKNDKDIPKPEELHPINPNKEVGYWALGCIRAMEPRLRPTVPFECSSAYAFALGNGFKGSEKEFLASLTTRNSVKAPADPVKEPPKSYARSGSTPIGHDYTSALASARNIRQKLTRIVEELDGTTLPKGLVERMRLLAQGDGFMISEADLKVIRKKDFLTAWTSLGSLPVKEKLAEVFSKTANDFRIKDTYDCIISELKSRAELGFHDHVVPSNLIGNMNIAGAERHGLVNIDRSLLSPFQKHLIDRLISDGFACFAHNTALYVTF